jgi:glycosyltransferase involved in cell wall biosynthesis
MVFSFVGPIKDKWDRVGDLLKSIDRTFKLFDYEIILVDDFSTSDERRKAFRYLSKYEKLRVIYNKKHQGIEASMNNAVLQAKGSIIIPVDADLRFVWPLYFLYLHMLFKFRPEVSFCFMKSKGIDSQTFKTLGIVGWAPKSGLQQGEKLLKDVIEKKIHVAGGATSYKRKWFIKNGGYQKEFGPAADFYINQKAVLQKKAWYLGKVATINLIDKKSETSKYSYRKYIKISKRILSRWANTKSVNQMEMSAFLRSQKKEINKNINSKL